MKPYSLLIKRPADFIISLTALLILSPIILLILLIQLVVYRGKPFYIQRRPGKNEKIFSIIKFKTMYDLKDSQGRLLPDEERLSTFGRILRSSSLDEILQFINILKGEMSLIGPRPLLIEYLDLYNEFQAQRHLVRPGITGWAQVKGRNLLDWQERFKLDVWYVENVSFGLDLQIVGLTILKVVTARGISGKESVTMKKFQGN